MFPKNHMARILAILGILSFFFLEICHIATHMNGQNVADNGTPCAICLTQETQPTILSVVDTTLTEIPLIKTEYLLSFPEFLLSKSQLSFVASIPRAPPA